MNEEFSQGSKGATGSGGMVPSVDRGNSNDGDDSPLTREEWEQRYWRLVIAMTLTIIVVLVGNGIGWTLYNGFQNNACTDRNQRAAATNIVLTRLRNATLADHDINQSKIWQEYLDAVKKNPLPKC